ncbi:radical SAM family heme chaperone HemW [Chelatococcus composti]|uniref:Heme chaperone HemW n=1 Tax=Chelatococcus composti TaxID=1743235 RepID=A0A841K792_9HYPH|nr:radical SAM family heme chaperone HemW [Chelatococcus composti]MBB6167322.1 oxygen-independent coproporphyrinogen-3 oxidase [Chelatococcus composti]MBS7735529.1 coproporphyrinogen III oxidase [Chelatococcus composti]GGG30980.1 coproporphyrinogen III oxidase [Chelatococcus composti]
MIHPTADAGFGVYLHWPFCASKCPYCDFNSHVRHTRVDEERFVAAFAREIAHNAALTGPREVTSIFFGGGTPSLMRPATVGAILDAVARHWSIAPDAEISLEANPTSVEAERFRGYRAAGVNRVSLGVQALNDADLRRLGRMHTAAEALAAVRIAADTFERYSFDLIYARPHQTPAAWAAELKEAIGHAVEHLSLYQLTIEPGTWFERLVAAGKLSVPDSETGRALYDVTQEVCARHGLPGYEISNHARPGAECRHNLLYWRYGEYAGIGPGAHGRLVTAGGRLATVTVRGPEDWLSAVERDGHGIESSEILSPEAQGDEFLLMGLRLVEGIDPGRFAALAGRPLDAGRVDALIAEGLLARDAAGRLRATEAGFPVLDALVADLSS